MLRLLFYIQSIIFFIVPFRIRSNNIRKIGRTLSNPHSLIIMRLSLVRLMGALAASLLFLSTVSFGQAQSAPAGSDPAGSNPVGSASGSVPVGGTALPSEIMELRREGHEALYNLDSATAVAKFEEIRKRMPHHPAGDLYLATALWLGHLNKTRRLQTTLHGARANFYAGTG